MSIVSGKTGEDIAVGAMKAGAHDYIIKGNLTESITGWLRDEWIGKIKQLWKKHAAARLSV